MKNDTASPLEASPMAESSNDSFDNTAVLELLARWRAENATDDPEEIAAAERELAEFKKAMNENRTSLGGHPVFP